MPTCRSNNIPELFAGMNHDSDSNAVELIESRQCLLGLLMHIRCSSEVE